MSLVVQWLREGSYASDEVRVWSIIRALKWRLPGELARSLLYDSYSLAPQCGYNSSVVVPLVRYAVVFGSFAVLDVRVTAVWGTDLC